MQRSPALVNRVSHAFLQAEWERRLQQQGGAALPSSTLLQRGGNISASTAELRLEGGWRGFTHPACVSAARSTHGRL